ncbi:MAG: hypothetical protein ACOC2H_01455 [Spirochaetota bacterium]
MNSKTRLLEAVRNINDNTPASVKAGVTVVGTINDQNYSADGIAYLQYNPARVKVELHDRIFKSPVVQILATPERMTTYYPVDQAVNTVDGDFSDPDLQGRADSQLFLAYAFSAKIPLVDDYSVSDYTTGRNGTEILTLSNETVTEEITFSNGNPTQVVLTNSKNGTQYVLTYYGMYSRNGFTFFKKIRAHSTITGDRATIHYNVVHVNPSFNPSAVFSLEIPDGTRTIR